ncbi:MAG: M48 family metallopeptidase [Parcubacteria group bacterium]|nr:M48 family metallopeptidase [Parcubacteria group bacterium]
MATIYTQQTENIQKTWLLLTVFLFFVIGIGWFFSQIYRSPGILYFAVFISFFMSFSSYWWSDKLVLSLAKAKPVEKKDFPELYNVVENLTITAGLPMPKIYIIEEEAMNAFATGRDPKHAVVAATRGLLEKLNKVELEGVIAHELSHIGNRDMLINSMAVVLVGVISLVSDFFMRSLLWGGFRSRNNEREGNQFQGLLIILGIAAAILAPIAATLIRLAISRKREFLADASGVLLTRYPEGLVSALKKISTNQTPLRVNAAISHIYFDNPLRSGQKFDKAGTSWFIKLFMTHPPIEERIRALREFSV